MAATIVNSIRVIYMPTCFLPASADLSVTLLNFWHAGSCKVVTRRDFWALVGEYMKFTERSTPSDGVDIVLSHTRPEQMALFIALIASGRLPALFPPNTPLQDEDAFFKQQRHALLKVNPSRIFVFSDSLHETVRRIDPDLGGRATLVPRAGGDVVTDVEVWSAREEFRKRLSSPSPIFVQHSSGTTGIKKAVAITGTALALQFEAYWATLRAEITRESLRIASWLPLYHDMGLLTSLLLPLMGDDIVSIVDPFEWISRPDTLLRMIETDKSDIVWMPNFAYRHYTRLANNVGQHDIRSVKLWIDCSEPCRYADALGFEKAFTALGVEPAAVVGCYAMAETVFAATMCVPGERRGLALPLEVKPGDNLIECGALIMRDGESDLPETGKIILSSGRLLPGIEIAILVDHQCVADGIYGEIALRGAYVFDGYKGMDREASNFDGNGFFRTGDLGTVIDGHLFVFGRTKEIVIVNGKNLFAGDIEDVVCTQVAGIKKGRAVAFGMDSEQTGSEELIVVAEKAEGSEIPLAEMRQHINRVISDCFMIKPRDVRVVEERWLIKSTSGKIARGENKAKYIETFRTKSRTT